MSELNPFAVNRAEYMRDLWKYYVPIKELDVETSKSLVVEGGRGTGKSTVFLCNCWRSRLSEAESHSGTTINDFFENKSIGLYYKVDGAFLSAMDYCERSLSEKTGIFNTYLSVELCKELFSYLATVSFKKSILSEEECKKIFKTYTRSVHTNKAYVIQNFNELIEDCDIVLNAIEDCLNYGSEINDSLIFRVTASGSIFKALIEEIIKCSFFANHTFRVFIDEFESLCVWQQKQVNTLIKQSGSYLIYNICMRHNGFKTYQTNSDNEIIQPTHDFKHFKFENLLETAEYKNTLKLICEKRFQMFFEQMNLAQQPSTDIEFYLGNYSADLELERFDKKRGNFKKLLRNRIRALAKNDHDADDFILRLCDEPPLLNARLHLALLLRAKQYRPSLEELSNAYQDWRSGKKSKGKEKYDEWLHATKNGLIFLLAKDFNLDKWYFGFDAYVMLSSGIVRYFLELCEHAFNFAIMNDFQWDHPQRLTPEIQTKAAKFVSRHKVEEIASFPTYGHNLRIFVQFLGQIFKDLHRNDRLTLGEPEPNHFTMDSLDSLENREVLDNAITCSVLQELPQTKGKESVNTHIHDYHLNKIYTPYFEISYLKKRKLVFTNEALSGLLSGDKMLAQKITKEYLDNYWANKTALPESDSPQQIRLF